MVTEPDVWDRLCRVAEIPSVFGDAGVECMQQRKAELIDFKVQAQAIILDILRVPC